MRRYPARLSFRFKAILLSVPMAVGLAAVPISMSDATTAGVDLSMTGSVVAHVASGQPGQELAFLFTMKNNSTTTGADVDFTFTVTNGSADASDYICPLISNHFDINPDTPACEPGNLGPTATTQAGILVTPSVSGISTTVKACAFNLSGATDPVSSNNCRTLRVPIS